MVLPWVRPMAADTAARDADARLGEACALAAGIGLDVVMRAVYSLRARRPSTLLGEGQVAMAKDAIADNEVTLAVVDAALSPVQQRNLERAWGVKVIDRTGLILEIFGERARTREGSLQVELAHLDYQRSRLVRSWTHLERQRGGFGVMGGPGETQIETDRRLIAEKIGKLKRELTEVRRTRTLQRSARKRAPAPTVALVGYTNAGKSTLFNRLTDAGVMAKDMLFATLDPTLRSLKLPDGRSAVLSDTVGFISDLPHELVEAFRATLEEVSEADVVLHVRDIASDESAAQADDVREVLSRLEVELDDSRILEVWNKADLVSEADRADLVGYAERARPPAVLVSSVSGEGVADLLAAIAQRGDESPPLDVTTAAGDGAAVAWLYQHGRVLTRDDAEDGTVRFSVSLSEQALGRFEQMFPAAALSR